MDYKNLLYEKTDNIAKITVNRPDAMNAQSRLLLEEIDNAFTQADEDDEVRVIIVAGAGKNFSAGHDLCSKEELEDRKEHPWPATAWGYSKRSERLHWNFGLHWRNIPKPTIAMVQGYCIMGGWMLASACDIIIASEDAKFSDSSARWGGQHVQYFTFPWDLGPRKAKEYLWTGDFIDGKEAWRLGMVNRVVPREHLEEETMELAKKIAECDPLALKFSKISVNQQMDIMGYTAAMRASYSFMTARQSLEMAGQPPAGVQAAKERDKGRDTQ